MDITRHLNVIDDVIERHIYLSNEYLITDIHYSI